MSAHGTGLSSQACPSPLGLQAVMIHLSKLLPEFVAQPQGSSDIVSPTSHLACTKLNLRSLLFVGLFVCRVWLVCRFCVAALFVSFPGEQVRITTRAFVDSTSHMAAIVFSQTADELERYLEMRTTHFEAHT